MADRTPSAKVSAAQFRLLQRLADEKEVGPDDGVVLATLFALRDRGYIEACERMYFGPRRERYRLTERGRMRLARRNRSSRPQGAPRLP